MFSRFRRGSTTPTGELSCYGKLPFDREFLRYNLDSDEGRWLVSWVDDAHQILAGADAAPEDDLELRVTLARQSGRKAVAALIRPSRDGGGRSYPVCVFTVLDAREVRDQWHLVPLWLASVWGSIQEVALDSSIRDRKAFASALERATCTGADVGSVAAGFDDEARRELASPWAVLAGTDGDGARDRALAFAALVRAQADARTETDGVAVRVPLDPGTIADPPLRASLWLRLFAALCEARDPVPALVEARRRAGGEISGYVFGRIPAADDLAHILAHVGDPAIDDVGQKWNTEPSDRARLLVENLLDPNARCLADLWKST